eukprot:scaffold2926_cov258-Alexandrium_tamarense.AAC.5
MSSNSCSKDLRERKQHFLHCLLLVSGRRVPVAIGRNSRLIPLKWGCVCRSLRGRPTGTAGVGVETWCVLVACDGCSRGCRPLSATTSSSPSVQQSCIISGVEIIGRVSCCVPSGDCQG